MATRDDVERIAKASEKVVAQARRELQELMEGYLDQPFDAVRDRLLAVTPMVVAKYGDAGAALAAEWYEELHPGSYRAVASRGRSALAIERSVRYGAGFMYASGHPEDAVMAVTRFMQLAVMESVRRTIVENARRDQRRPTFALVPRGVKTCAFCTMLASRGFVYSTDFGGFHDDCDCQFVPSWTPRDRNIAGYDPEALEKVYLDARKNVDGRPTPQAIVSKMREMHPDMFTDGHVAK